TNVWRRAGAEASVFAVAQFFSEGAGAWSLFSDAAGITGAVLPSAVAMASAEALARSGFRVGRGASAGRDDGGTGCRGGGGAGRWAGGAARFAGTAGRCVVGEGRLSNWGTRVGGAGRCIAAPARGASAAGAGPAAASVDSAR